MGGGLTKRNYDKAGSRERNEWDGNGRIMAG